MSCNLSRRDFFARGLAFAPALTMPSPLPESGSGDITYHIVTRAVPAWIGERSGYTFDASDLPERANQLYLYRYTLRGRSRQVVPGSFARVWSRPSEGLNAFLASLWRQGYPVGKIIVVPGIGDGK